MNDAYQGRNRSARDIASPHPDAPGAAITEGLGAIRCDNSVFKELAAHSALQVDGIAGIGGRSSIGDIILFREKGSGIEVLTAQENANLGPNEVVITINVNIFFGHNIYEVCTELQRRIKDEVEATTSYRCKSVNVNVQGLRPREGREARAAESRLLPHSASDDK